MEEMKKYLEYYEKTLEELIVEANKCTAKNFDRTVEFCSIVSAKTGACSEDCKYCAQSAKSKAEIKVHPLMTVEEVKKAALSAKENGAVRFGIVTSGKTLSAKDFQTVLEMVKAVSEIEGLSCCGCFGILNEEQMMALKEAGLERYNHNINTSAEYYGKICTTHSFEDRINTIRLAKKAGMSLCAGVLIGMGESREDRIKMALTLRELEPESVPINILDPIKGTELEGHENDIDIDEILKTICIFRIILPNSRLRYAGGRMTRLPLNYQKLGVMAGMNAMLVGNCLTTLGSNVKDDLKMLDTIGFTRCE